MKEIIIILMNSVYTRSSRYPPRSFLRAMSFRSCRYTLKDKSCTDIKHRNAAHGRTRSARSAHHRMRRALLVAHTHTNGNGYPTLMQRPKRTFTTSTMSEPRIQCRAYTRKGNARCIEDNRRTHTAACARGTKLMTLFE